MSNSIKNLSNEQLLKYHHLFISANKRAIDTKMNGYDTKFLYHLVRLINEIEQILTEGDLNLERNREQLKAIRRGDEFVGFEDIHEWFNKKESELETIYNNCTILPHGPRREEIKDLLLKCLEHHFGSLDKMIQSSSDEAVNAIFDVKRILAKF